MSIESKLSGHWTDDELIQHLYGVGPENEHIDLCRECQARLSAAQAHRQMLELDSSTDEAVGYDFLTAQRRSIYAKLTGRRTSWLPEIFARRWASAAATFLVLGGSVLFYQQKRLHDVASDRVSDAQLAQDVSCMAQDSEPSPTAPLQALFEE